MRDVSFRKHTRVTVVGRLELGKRKFWIFKMFYVMPFVPISILV